MNNPVTLVTTIGSLMFQLVELAQHIATLKEDPEVKAAVQEVKDFGDSVSHLFHHDARQSNTPALPSEGQ